MGEIKVLIKTGWKYFEEDQEPSESFEEKEQDSLLLCPDCLALIETQS
jgi:hypothetical protein